MKRAERWSRLVGLVTLVVGLYFLVPVSLHPTGGMLLRGASALAVLVCLAAAVVTELRRSASDDSRGVTGLVSAIVGVLVVFALAYYALEIHQPDQLHGLHTRIDALYFSASTMLTIGYGDVHAVGQSARALVLVQMVFDVIFVAAAAGMLGPRVRRSVAARAHRGSASSDASSE